MIILDWIYFTPRHSISKFYLKKISRKGLYENNSTTESVYKERLALLVKRKN